MDTNPTSRNHIPSGLDIAAQWSWRVLLIIALIAVFSYVLSQSVVLWVPLVVAAFLAGLLNPIVHLLYTKGLPRVWATILTFMGALLGFGLLMRAVVEELIKGFEGIWDQVAIAAQDLDAFIATHTTGLPFALNINVDGFSDNLVATIQRNADGLINQVVNLGSGASSLITVLIITLFAAFFFLLQGKEIWQFLLTLTPKAARNTIDAGAQRGWIGVVAYVRFQAGIAILEGIWIGLTAHLLGMALAFPLGIFVLLGAMIPILGALFTGIIATLLAFASGGIMAALGMALSVLAINQLETVFLQPWLMGKAVNLHPLVILLSVIGGSTLGDLVGALIAVPSVAFVIAASFGIRDYIANAPSEPAPAKLIG